MLRTGSSYVIAGAEIAVARSQAQHARHYQRTEKQRTDPLSLQGEQGPAWHF